MRLNLTRHGILLVGALLAGACSDKAPSEPQLQPRYDEVTDRPFDTKTPAAPSSRPSLPSGVSFSMLTSGLATTDLNGGVTPANLAQDLVGSGVTISNVTFSGSNVAAGRFTGGGTIIGIEAGVMLGSGVISNVIGPNQFDAVATALNTAGDAQLALLTGRTSLDATVLEFDFVPTGDSVFVQYVFSSDEYNEYVNTQFDDAFAFFVNGTNCAVTAEGSRVSINTINNGNPFGSTPKSHPELFVNNDLSDGGGSYNTEMDGFTTVLTCAAPVTPNAANHMKLAISDMSDRAYDSHVFLKAGSFSTAPPVNQQPLFVAPTPDEGSTHVVNIGQTLTLQIAAEDPDENDDVTIVASGAPAGASFTNVGPGNPVLATFSFTATAADAGVHAVTFEVSDGNGASNTRHLNIFVNQPPAFDAPTPADGAVLTVKAGYPLSFSIAADDPDAGQLLTLAHSALPAGATLGPVGPADPLAATFAWTPAPGAAGMHSFTYSVSDPYGATTETRAVTINVVGVINVTVLHNGLPVPNQIVAAVNNLTGVKRANGSRSIEVTNALGTATIADLGIDADGKYCVYTKPIRTADDATLDETDVVPPTNGYTPQQPSGFAPALTGPDSNPYDNTVPFTRDNYVSNCISSPVIHLTTTAGIASVTLNVVAGSSMDVTWEDLDGNPLQIPGWVVIDANGLIPWFPPGLGADGIKAGLLMTGAPADATGTVNLTGLKPATPVYIESGIVNVPGQGELTFTIQTTTPTAASSQDLGTQTLEPLLCTLNRHAEPAGDHSPGKIDFIGWVKDGFRATYGVPLTPRQEISVFYSQRGTGDAKIHMRFVTPAGTLNLVAQYTWNGTSGVVTSRSGGAVDAGVNAEAYFALQPDGSVRVTWSVTSLPAGFTSATYALHTSGDQFPDPAKRDLTSAFQPVPIPSVCLGGQGNDDQWWIGLN